MCIDLKRLNIIIKLIMSEEEEIEITNEDKTLFEEDKLQFVVNELRHYCDYFYLPFFKTTNTFTLFEKAINNNIY
jgi:hypothetical protein